MMIMIIFFCVMCYFLGTLPSGIICASCFNLGNLREIGSGNIGATNVLRTGNKAAAAITLILDALKGTAAVSMIYFMPDALNFYGAVFGLCAFLGHVFPVWSKFKGGKGVATYLGVLFGLNFIFGIFGAALWLIGGYLSKISSIGALNMALLMPTLLFLGQEGITLPIVMGLASLILFYKHQENIRRILNKSEPKIGQ